MLLEKGADPKYRREGSNWPIVSALVKENLKVAQILIVVVATLNSKDMDLPEKYGFFGVVSGIGNQCEDCGFQFDLCYKCYELRDVLHDPGHHFRELGPEFIEVFDEEVSNSQQQDSPAQDSDSELDSESSSSSSN
ncbi:hypothetical protein PG995_004426 [Apiospora arundinis]